MKSETIIVQRVALALACCLATTLKGQNLFVVDNVWNSIAEYTTSGATVNASLFTGLPGPVGIAISGNNLFVANFAYGNPGGGSIGEYTTSGATVNASLIRGLDSAWGIAISGNNLLSRIL